MTKFNIILRLTMIFCEFVAYLCGAWFAVTGKVDLATFAMLMAVYFKLEVNYTEVNNDKN